MSEPQDHRPSVLERMDQENAARMRPDGLNQLPYYGFKHWAPWQKAIGFVMGALVVLGWIARLFV